MIRLRRSSEGNSTLVQMFFKSVFTEGPMAAVRRAIRYRRSVREASTGGQPSSTTRKFCLLVAGCPGGTFHYRCEHALEELAELGLTGDVVRRSAVQLAELVPCYELFVLQRVPLDAGVEAFLAAAQAAGKKVLFDIDDLLIDELDLAEILHLRRAPAVDRDVAARVMRGHAATLARVDGAVVSSELLAEELRRRFSTLAIWVKPNAVTGVMLRAADAVPARPTNGLVTLGYFSGTRTHGEDLESIAPVLQELLRRGDCELLLAGDVEVPKLLRGMPRVRRQPLVEWQQLPALLAQADVHLAPLRGDNRYAAAKSELKFLEGALVRRPVVATNFGRFAAVIRNDVDGFCCDDEAQWRRVLTVLVEDADLRHRVGTAARATLERSHTTAAVADRWRTILDELVGLGDGDFSAP